MEMVDAIAWPKRSKPEMAQGVAFFSLMRNLTATGFYTSEIGVKDVGYIGNAPNVYNGVPEEVLAIQPCLYRKGTEGMRLVRQRFVIITLFAQHEAVWN